MELRHDVGRNDPCPCGSGRKFKKCCADATARALQATAGELDVAMLVRRVIDEDDWSLLDEHVDTAIDLFAPGEPLEHVRFADDAVATFRADVDRLCRKGWLQAAEREVVYVLEEVDLEPDERDALRVALQLNRRFGAGSPIVEELATLQLRERATTARRVADAFSRAGLRAGDLDGGLTESVTAWLGMHPDLLAFVDWLALSLVSPDEGLAELWWGGVARRVCDTCLALSEGNAWADPRPALLLAASTLHPGLLELARVVVLEAALRQPSPDELCVYEGLTKRRQLDGDEFATCMQRIVEATRAAGDYAHSAILRSIEAHVARLHARSR